MKIRELFDQCAQDYDQQRRILVPEFDSFYGAALKGIQSDLDKSFSVLDLGAGTGLFSAMILRAYKNCRITLTDVSEKMLNQAKKRFANESRVTIKTQIIWIWMSHLSTI